MLHLVLVRHAEAGLPDPKAWPDDARRPLTHRGIRKFKKAAAGLGNLIQPDVVLTSPFARTMQTADLLNWDAGWPAAVADEALDDASSPEQTVAAIRALKGKPTVVGLVGHGPNLQNLSSYLLGTDTPAIDFDKGGAALIEVPKRTMKAGTGTLKWSMRQKELKKHR